MKTINRSLLLVLLCTLFNNVAAQNLAISTELDRNFSTATLNVTLLPNGFKQFDYLKATSTSVSTFSKVKIPFSASSKNRSFNFITDAIDSIEIVVKDIDGNINWDKIELRIDEYVDKPIIIGDYVGSAIALADGWMQITLPIYDDNFESIALSNVRYIQFPFNRAAGIFNLGVKSIHLKGVNTDIEWLGSQKFDNYFSSSNGMNYQLLLSNAEPSSLVSTGLTEVNSGTTTHKTEMPFLHYQNKLAVGDKKFFAFVMDDMGQTFYSDTVEFNIAAGLVFEKSNVSCAGAADGSITVEMIGGTPPYSYNWNNGFDGTTLTGLAQGYYQITVTDSLGQEDSVSVEIKAPPQLSVSLINQECSSEGEFLVNISGGMAPYSFQEEGGDFQEIDGDTIKNLAQFVSSKEEDLIFKALETLSDNSVVIVCSTTDTLRINEVVYSTTGGQFLVKLNAIGTVEWVNTLLNGQIIELESGKEDDIFIAAVSEDQNIALMDGNGIELALPAGHDLIVLSKEGTLKHSISTQSSNLKDFEIDQWNNIVVLDAITAGLVIKKFSPLGVEIWRKHINGKFQAYAIPEIAVNSSGEIALIANSIQNISIDSYLLTAGSKVRILILKMNEQGVINWVKSIGNSSKSHYGYQVALNDLGDVFVGVGLGVKENLNIQKHDGNSGQMVWNNTFSRDWFSGISELIVGADNHIYFSGLSWEINLIFESDEYVLNDYLIELNEAGEFASYRNIFSYPYDFHSRLPFAISSSGYLIYNTLEGYHTWDAFRARIGNLVSEGPNATFTVSSDSEYFSVKDNNGCKLEQALEMYSLPQPELCYISIAENNPTIHINNLPNDITVDIYREGDALNQYDLIATEVPVADTLIYVDTTISTLNRSFRYKVKLSDNCGNESAVSDFHQTIHLMLSEGIVDKHVNLQWNEYIGKSYNAVNIYKGSSLESLSLLTTLPANLYTYTDTDAAASDLYYKLELVGVESCDQVDNSMAYSSRATESVLKISSNLVKRGLQGGYNAIAYPNPVNIGSLLFGNSEPAAVRMSDLSGVNVYSSKINAKEGIPTSALKPGIYIVNYQLSGLNVHHKIIVVE